MIFPIFQIGFAKNCTDIIAIIGCEIELDAIVEGTSDTTASNFYDPSLTYTTSTITVLWSGEKRNDKWFTGGLLQAGDAIIYCDPTSTIKIRDLVIKNSITYEVTMLEMAEAEGSQIYRKCGLKRQSTN
jgi:hypothetical protein